MRDNRGDTKAETDTDTDGDTPTDAGTPRPEASAPLPDLKPWNQAGWIFLDGDCVAIERQGEAGEEPERKARVLAD